MKTKNEILESRCRLNDCYLDDRYRTTSIEAMEEYAQQQVKNCNILAVSNNEVAVAFGDWLRTQRADIFYGYPTTKKLFEMYKKATDC